MDLNGTKWAPAMFATLLDTEYILVQLYKKPMPEIYIGYIDANSMNLTSFGARCSSVVRAIAHGAMGRRIDPSWGGPIELFLVPASAPRLV